MSVTQERFYLRSSQTNPGTGGDVYDLSSQLAGGTTDLTLSVNSGDWTPVGWFTKTLTAEEAEAITTNPFGLSWHVVSHDGDALHAVKMHRHDSSGNLLAESSFYYGATSVRTGTHTFTSATFNTTWNEGDQIRFVLYIVRNSGHGGISVTFRVDSTSSFMDIPFDFPAPEQHEFGGSRSNLSASASGAGFAREEQHEVEGSRASAGVSSFGVGSAYEFQFEFGGSVAPLEVSARGAGNDGNAGGGSVAASVVASFGGGYGFEVSGGGSVAGLLAFSTGVGVGVEGASEGSLAALVVSSFGVGAETLITDFYGGSVASVVASARAGGNTQGYAIKTSDLAGDAAEMIVVPDNSTFKKHEKEQYHWGDVAWFRRHPNDYIMLFDMRAAFDAGMAGEGRLQSVVPQEAEGSVGFGAEGGQQSTSDMGVSDALLGFEGLGHIARVPWILDPGTGLAWTLVQNGVTYEVQRSLGGGEAETVYVGENPAWADYTVNSSYRVRAINEYGEGPWSPRFTVAAEGAMVVLDTRFREVGDRDSFVYVNVLTFGRGRKLREEAAPVTVQVLAGGGGRREGVRAGSEIQVSAGGGGVTRRASGSGSVVEVALGAGHHLGETVSLGASFVAEGSFYARPHEEPLRFELGTIGRARRRRVRV